MYGNANVAAHDVVLVTIHIIYIFCVCVCVEIADELVTAFS